MNVPADRNLLFGLLALQNGMIDQSALVAAFHAWTLTKNRLIAEILLGQGAIDADDRALLESLVTKHLKRHGDDVEKSLAAVPAPRSVVSGLVAMGDEDVSATLGHIDSGSRSNLSGKGADVDATSSMGRATGDGQRFRVLRPHARGGLGAVFVALDAELNREVALKQILDHHADDPTSRTRFVLEAEITGGLEHPGIVPVYGLGSDGGGRPYYVMRFIRGESLKDAIAAFHADPAIKDDPGKRSLAVRKLLRRFTDVCNAIEYAHTRGVIHRDIKPANIIVGKYGETLVVDWGLAKAMGRPEPGLPSDERTLMPSSASGSAETLPGSAMGTPAFMSPEQAAGDLDGLGPRSDVYSLGATLYCLLTGKPPFEGDDIGAVLRAVGKGDFPRPRWVDPSIDPALEAVCLKAMATRPEDRYASCRALAEDVERWMADEPVSAWAEPWTRKQLRWLTRHRTGVTGAAAAVLAGVVGLSAVLAVQARANLALADKNTALLAANAKIEARYNLAVLAIKTFHTGVSEDFLLKEDKFKDLRDRLLKSASDFYGKLGALLGKDADLASRRALWQANFELAQLTAKVGRIEDALDANRQVLAAREALAPEFPADPEVSTEVGRSMTVVADLLQATGKTKEAKAMYCQAETLLVELVHTVPEAAEARNALAKCRSSLGSLLLSVGRDDEALSVLGLARADQEAMAAGPGATAESRQDLAGTIQRVAYLLWGKGRLAEAEAEYRKAFAIQQKLADDNPAVPGFRNSLASGHDTVGRMLMHSKPAEAEAELRTALAIQKKLVDDYPAVTRFGSLLRNIRANRGLVFWIMGKLPEAEAEYRMALAISQKLAENNPADTILARSHADRSELLLAAGKSSEAEAELRTALAIQQKLVDDYPAVPGFRDSLAGSHRGLATLLLDNGKSAEAEAENRKALPIAQKLAEDYPDKPEYQKTLAGILSQSGNGLTLAGKTGEALGFYTREETIRRKLAEASSAPFWERDFLATCQTNMAGALRRSGRLDEALAACERSLATREPLVKKHPEATYLRSGLGEAYLRLGEVRRDLGSPAGAAEAWKLALANFDFAGSKSGGLRFSAACCHASLAGLAGRPGSRVSVAEATDQAERAMSMLSEAVALGYRNANAYRTESALDPLRNREDFKKLIAEMEKAAKPTTSK